MQGGTRWCRADVCPFLSKTCSNPTWRPSIGIARCSASSEGRGCQTSAADAPMPSAVAADCVALRKRSAEECPARTPVADGQQYPGRPKPRGLVAYTPIGPSGPALPLRKTLSKDGVGTVSTPSGLCSSLGAEHFQHSPSVDGLASPHRGHFHVSVICRCCLSNSVLASLTISWYFSSDKLPSTHMRAATSSFCAFSASASEMSIGYWQREHWMDQSAVLESAIPKTTIDAQC